MSDDKEIVKQSQPRKAKVKAESGTATVTVALKHPTGIVLEAFEKVPTYEPVLGGGMREAFAYRSTGKQYPVNGNRVPFGHIPSFKIIGGYALTSNIPKDVWEIWLEQHHDHPLVENDLITAYEREDMAEDYATENAGIRSGMEAMAQKGDPRVDKRRTRDGKFVDAVGGFNPDDDGSSRNAA